MNIFAFPYAFGNSTIFFDLKRKLSPDINLFSFDYPGHGGRLSENLLHSIEEIASDAYERIIDKIEKPYSLLGYSMGCLVVLEIFKILKKRECELPTFIFLMAHDGKKCKFDNDNFEKFDNNQVKEILYKYGKTSELILNNEEMLDILVPIVKADLIALRDYKIDEIYYDTAIKTKIIIIRGNKETKCHCKRNWEKVFKKKVSFLEMKGGHFFLFEKEHDNITKFMHILKNYLFI